MTTELWISAGVIFLLLFVSAFFSGSETALTATSRARMHELARRGSKRAAIVQSLIAKRERLIGAVLLGNNIVNISASALATSLLLGLFGEAGILYATIGMTVLVLIFGEVLPKTYAILAPDTVALFAAPIIRVLVAVFGPVVMTIEWLVKKVLQGLGVDTSGAANVLSAHDELRGAINLHHHEGAVVKKDRDMLGGILDLQDLSVTDVMVHRTKMHMVDAASPPAEILTEVLKSGHTRLPVYKDNSDNIIGILHAKDFLSSLQSHGNDINKVEIEEIMSPPWFVPGTRAVPDQLNAFLRRKAHFALAVDEYGEVMGLITLEDIIEEIVGDITDEHDVAAKGMRSEPSGAFVIDGTVPIRDLNRLQDWNLPDEEATTLAGLVIHEARMIPDVGQAFTFHGFRFEVLRKRKHQLTQIRVTPVQR
ncbi:MAG: HlyC/CorC family transporter [Aestuariivirgaceae bacterium]|nr:HlyC/CorC family transporter [Aestuariivirgaceae bacterium]